MRVACQEMRVARHEISVARLKLSLRRFSGRARIKMRERRQGAAVLVGLRKIQEKR
jgi:hypothetical protein